VRRVIRHQQPPRIAWDFHDERFRDIRFEGPVRLVHPAPGPLREFGAHEALLVKSGFHGEVRLDDYGNIIGRLEGKTKGECVRGALEEDWSLLESYRFPEIDRVHAERVKAQNLRACDSYVLAGLPFGVFSTLRDLRLMSNALMDTAAEPEMLQAYMERFIPFAVEQVHIAADCGVDGVMIADDWGMQFSPFISPASFRELFKPVYKRITDACHERGIDFILHSCGFVLPLVDDMIDAGVDVFQFDQPEAAGSRLWAEKYSDKAAFYCPVDIQKVMPTGDRELIEKTALDMVNAFRQHGGALIAKDYPTWHDIGVDTAWARWAMDVITANSEI